jgi:IclR family transcriptional regulator, acetate operon repressor
MRQSESVRAAKARTQQIEPAERREPNTALKKTLAVLELFAAENRPMTASMVAAQLGMSRQAAGRLLHQLEDLGLILRLPEDFYILGPRANKLALDIIRTSHISASVRAILQEVVARVGETSNVGMLDGYDLVYIDRVECNWPLRVQLRPGSRVPSHCTAIGKLLLAHLPSRRRERLISVMPLDRFTEHTITDPRELSDHFRQIREQGYSINNQEDSVGLIALAVPVRNSENKVFAGLAIHGPEVRMSIEDAREHLGLLQKAANQLGDALEFSSNDE